MIVARRRRSRAKLALFQPITQPTQCDVLYDLRGRLAVPACLVLRRQESLLPDAHRRSPGFGVSAAAVAGIVLIDLAVRIAAI